MNRANISLHWGSGFESRLRFTSTASPIAITVVTFLLVFRILIASDETEPEVKEALSEGIQQEIVKEIVKFTASSGPDPNRFPPRSSTTNSSTEKKKFDVQEVEIWILLASMFGAISALITLALITFSLWKLRIFTKKYPDIYKISRV